MAAVLISASPLCCYRLIRYDPGSGLLIRLAHTVRPPINPVTMDDEASGSFYDKDSLLRFLIEMAARASLSKVKKLAR